MKYDHILPFYSFLHSSRMAADSDSCALYLMLKYDQMRKKGF
jgi:hypothetical protein